MSSTDRFQFETLEDRTGAARISTGAPEPPAEWPRFTLLELMLATAAVAAQIGFYKLIGPYVLYGTMALWVALLVRQLDCPREAAVQLSAWIVGGFFIPLTLVTLLRDVSWWGLNDCAATVVFLTGGFTVWIVLRHVQAPVISACLCGWMAISGVGLLIAGCAVAVTTVENKSQIFPNSFLSAIPSLLAAVGTMTAGAVAAATHFTAARQAWRRSHRDSRALMLAPIGATLMITISFSAINLLIPSRNPPPPPTPATVATPSAPVSPSANLNTSTTSGDQQE